MSTDPIRIVAAIIRDDAGKVLLVRKRGTQAFMQPGGKIQPQENPLVALARELREELGCDCLTDPVPLGVFSAPAANEPGRIVEATLYAACLAGEALPCAEIDALAWIDPGRPGDVPLAPLTAMHVLPLATCGAPR